MAFNADHIKAEIRINRVIGPMTESVYSVEFTNNSFGLIINPPRSEKRYIADYFDISDNLKLELIFKTFGKETIELDPSSIFQMDVRKCTGNNSYMPFELSILDFIPELADGPVLLYPKRENHFPYISAERILIGSKSMNEDNFSYYFMKLVAVSSIQK